MKRVLFFVPYVLGKSASQRFRFEQYLNLLSIKGFNIKIKHLLNQNDLFILYNSKKKISKLLLVVKASIIRLYQLRTVLGCTYLFIHRELLPVGPPVFEWIFAKVLKKKIIYDFDDAIWLTDKTNESRLERMIRWRSKVGLICKWSYKVSCGNAYLADYARQFNSNVLINPTTIDTDNVHNPHLYNKQDLRVKSSIDTIVIGWTGSHTTLKYLEELYPALKEIESKFPEIVFLVIADRPPVMSLKNILFKAWSAETEVEDLMLADIGIMPLPDDEWSKGKCGFKALQYMALEIPALVSPVGVNTEIVIDGNEGFHCKTSDDWIRNIGQLIANETLRKEMGKRGRQKVINNYSVRSNTDNFLSLFT